MNSLILRAAVTSWGLLVVASGQLVADEAWAQKMFDSLQHDFGAVAKGSDVRYRFKVTNLYQETVHISNVRTSCGCTAAKPTIETLKTYEVAYVEVTMDTRRFSRQKNSNVIVTFDAPYPATVQLPISAYIRPDVVLNPGAVNFGVIDAGKPAERKVEIAYAGRSDWTIREVKTSNEYLTARVVETGRDYGRVNYELFVGVTGSAPVGAMSQTVTLVTDDASSPYVPVLVYARVEADITITPSVVSLGMLEPGQAKTVNVVIRGREPFRIEKIECDSDKQAFSVRLPDDAKKVHVLPLTCTPPETPGRFTETFTVTIAGRTDPVTFKAYGEIGETAVN